MHHVLAWLAPLALFAAAGSGFSKGILSIRGGPGTGGFAEGGSDEHLSSFRDRTQAARNHSWGAFGDTLEARGYAITEVREGAHKPGCNPALAAPCSNPVPLESMDLSGYDIIVFGSNNSRYSPAAVAAVMRFVDRGGGLLFLSDGNFGRNWADAPTSDQAFLDSVGWIMNQDHGFYSLSRAKGDFTDPKHALLQGVAEFGGEGVSPITVAKPAFNGFTSQVLARTPGMVHRNTPPYGGGQSGPMTSATEQDATLCAATRKAGRVAGVYDRNTFFNRNGAGSTLYDFDNLELGLNLFKWLSTRNPSVTLAPRPAPGRGLARPASGYSVRVFGGERRNPLGRRAQDAPRILEDTESSGR